MWIDWSWFKFKPKPQEPKKIECEHDDKLVCQGDEARAMAGYPELFECTKCHRQVFKGDPAHPFGVTGEYIGGSLGN